MIGVLAISHGKMAEGMLDAAHMFFGDDLPGVEALCFMSSDNPEDFDVKLKDAVARVNTGDGVIIFADLMGGTPANRSMYVLGDDVQVITGANMTMMLELLGTRLAEGTKVSKELVEQLQETGRTGIVNINALMNGGK
ncbi:MAG: PTS sugar transporter subunit IIA [Bulleidia sp.]|nr:PTS sugar transporter subunit IIA [Erysipelotrichaceae bacterium]MDY2781622.1 PTS sugar transporter subunit IIA [Bulleidia sp.]